MRRKSNDKQKSPANLFAHYNPKSPITEQYRLIRNNINFSSVDKQLKTIVVTSPEPSDGKTTTSANLAVVLAQQGKKVILVDADLRKPSVHYSFNVSNLDGLTSVLTQKISLDNAIIPSTIPNLSILTSGEIPPNPSELLDSNAMEIIIEELKGEFDFVIFDTPPVLFVIDSQIMANKCDGVIMVVSSGKTKRDVAVKAKSLLDNSKGRLIGIVMNGIVSKSKEYYIHYQ